MIFTLWVFRTPSAIRVNRSTRIARPAQWLIASYHASQAAAQAAAATKSCPTQVLPANVLPR